MSYKPKRRLRRALGRAWRSISARRRSLAASPDARAVLASRLFDPWYYGLQIHRKMLPIEAASHFLREGAASGLLPNPFTDFAGAGLEADAIAATLLDGSARTLPVRLLDDAALVEQLPRTAKDPGGPVGFYLVHAHAGTPVSPIGTRSWKQFVTYRDRQSKALRLILASGLFDRAYYEAQAGRRFAGDRPAVWHFLEVGEPAGLSPTQLYEQSWYRQSANLPTGDMPFAHFLRRGQTAGAAGPHFDARVHLGGHPEAAGHAGGPLGHFLEHAGADSLTVPEPASGVTPATLAVLRSAMEQTASEFAEQQRLIHQPPSPWGRWYMAHTAPPEGGAGQAVAIVSDAREWGATVAPRLLQSVLGQRHEAWTMHVAVDRDRPMPGGLAAAVAGDPRIVPVPTSQRSWAGRVHDVLETVDEPWTCFWQPRESWSPYFLSGLLAAAEHGAGAHAAIVDEPHTPADGWCSWRGALPDRSARLWQPPRSLSGMLLATRELRVEGGAFRVEAEDRYAWDLLLRRDVAGPFVPFVAVRGKALGSLPLATGLHSAHEHVLRAERILDWSAVDTALAGRVKGRTSLLVPTFRDWELTRIAVDRAVSNAAGDVEVVVVDNGSQRQVASILAGCFAADPRIHIVRVPCNTNFATASNLAFARSTGEFVVFLNNDTEACPGWLERLIEPLGRPEIAGAQPLLLYPDNTVQSAGTVFCGPHVIPVHLLASHPVEDLRPEIDLRFHAVTAACMAMRADVVAEVRGFDPIFVNGMEDIDLCLRAGSSGQSHFITVPEARVIHHESKTPGRFARVEANRLRLLSRWSGRLPGPETEHWERAGFTVTKFLSERGLPASRRRTAATPVLVRPPATVDSGPARGLPRLRWAIKIAAPGGPIGDTWGDTSFARDLITALRALGQEAFVDRVGAHERPASDHLDDVTLTLRGLTSAVIQPGATNVLWVISHPDRVTMDEISQGFDIVYAAGGTWAEQMSAGLGMGVRTLLQATDATRFNPGGPKMEGLDTLFVGRARNVLPPVIRDAVSIGADLAIFGDGWLEFVDGAYLRAEHLPNEDLPKAYRGARIVLNDHGEDMARLGFLSNRLFDAVATGARVISDPVAGLEEVFGPSVNTYRTPDELAALLEPASSRWADDATIAANAARVAAAHSFDQRARILLADVLDIRGVEHNLHDEGRH